MRERERGIGGEAAVCWMAFFVSADGWLLVAAEATASLAITMHQELHRIELRNSETLFWVHSTSMRSSSSRPYTTLRRHAYLLSVAAALALHTTTPPHSKTPHNPHHNRHYPRAQHPKLAAQPQSHSTVVPLYDPLDDETPFPFPLASIADATAADPPAAAAAVFRYRFERALHRRIVAHALEAADSVFGHCVLAGDEERPSGALELVPRGLARTGAIGVALRILDVQGQLADDGDASSEESVVLVRVAATFRFRVGTITRTIPFVCAEVEPLNDDELEADSEAAARAAELEAAAVAVFRRLLELSARLEASGEGASEAEERLAAPIEFLDAHERRTLGGEYASLRERFEVFSLGLCDLLELPYETAVAAMCTTSAAERLELVLLVLRDALTEVATLADLDGVGVDDDGADAVAASVSSQLLGRAMGGGGGGAFTPIDIPLGNPDEAPRPPAEELPEGTRLEYWWNEEWGWSPATVRRKIRLAAGAVLHTLEFDGYEQQWEDVDLAFGDGKRRWRPLR